MTFELENMVGVYRERPHLIYNLDTQPVLGEDGGKTWRRITDRMHDPETFFFKFTCKIHSDLARIAFAHPQMSEHIADLIADVQASGHGRVETIAHSREGRPVYRIEIANAADPESKKHAIIIAQQHAGEDAAGFLAEGLARFLISDKPDNRIPGGFGLDLSFM